MLTRDEARFRDGLKRVNVMPLGAAALAGTGLPLDEVTSPVCSLFRR